MPVTKAELGKILTKAATDPKFREALIGNPKKAARSMKVNLGNADLADLKKVFKDLSRFAARPGLHAADAENWSIGILTNLRNCPLRITGCPIDSDVISLSALKRGSK